METKTLHTPGPWVWQSFDGGKTIFLGTPNRGRLVVMDFKRVGMNAAGPRFSNRNGSDLGGVMRGADEIDVEAHPDARLIAAAPDLLAALKNVREFVLIENDESRQAVIQLDAAIDKATA